MYCRIGTVKDHYSNYIPVIYTKKKEIATYDSICHRYKNKEYLFSLETDGRRSGALPLHSIRNKFKMLQQPHV